MRGCVLAIVFLLGCTETHTLVVDLRTDYAPGAEIHEARTTLVGGDLEQLEPLALGDDLIGGRRIAELTALEAGRVRVRVELLDGARVVGAREMLVELDVDRAVTAVIGRACEGVSCPEACLNGECVEPGCTPETPELCPPETGCDDASDCAAPAADCAAASCEAGACLDAPVQGACTATEYCDPTEGCRAIPRPADAGPPEADAGSSCAPMTADCNGVPGDGCEANLSSSRAHCGGCGMPCLASERCEAGSCVSAVTVESVTPLGGAGASTRSFAMDVQPSGRLVVAGKLSGMADLGDGALTDAGADSGYLTYFGAAGAHEGILLFRSSGIASANGVDLNDVGQLWMIGEVRGTVSPPGGPGVAASVGIDPYWARYDVDRAFAGAGIDGRTGGELGHDVATVPDGGAIVVGYVSGDEVAGRAFSGPLPGAGSDAFVARLDPVGGVRWVRYFGGPGVDEARGVTLVADRVVVVGFFSDDVSFGGPTRTSRGDTDIFVVALDLDGNYVGDVTGGGPGHDEGLGIAAHSSGDVMVAGTISGGSFGTVSVSDGAGGDAMVARVGLGGSVRWVQSAGDDDNQVAHGVAVRGDAVYVAGYFQGSFPVGGVVLTAPAGTRSGYVARVDATAGTLDWAVDFDGGSTVALGVGADAADRVMASGYFSGSVDFGPRRVSAAGASDAFLVRLREP